MNERMYEWKYGLKKIYKGIKRKKKLKKKKQSNELNSITEEFLWMKE